MLLNVCISFKTIGIINILGLPIQKHVSPYFGSDFMPHDVLLFLLISFINFYLIFVHKNCIFCHY